MMSKEAMKLALEALEPLVRRAAPWGELDWLNGCKAITALREALAEQPAPQDSTCSNALRAQGKAYPRTCKKCGLGPCVELAQQALDKMAENARELGLDYEPARQETVAWLWELTGEVTTDPDRADGMWKPLYTSPPAQRTWVGLTNDEVNEFAAGCHLGNSVQGAIYKAVAKLKEKNT